MHFERCEEAGGDLCRGKLLGAGSDRHRQARSLEGSGRLERPVLLREVQVIGNRIWISIAVRRRAVRPRSGGRLVEPDQLVRLRRGEWAQRDTLEHAEDRAAAAGAQRERDLRRRGESGRARERSQGVAEVLQEGVHAGGQERSSCQRMGAGSRGIRPRDGANGRPLAGPDNPTSGQCGRGRNAI